MPTVKETARQKHDLLASYRAEIFEQTLHDLKAKARAEQNEERFPWKGEFRPREEIIDLYRERKRFDKRFTFDTFALAAIFFLIIFSGPVLIKFLSPKSNWNKGVDASEQIQTINAQKEN